MKSLRASQYYQAIKQRRLALLERRRGITPCNRYMMLELQRMLHESVHHVDVILDFIEAHVQQLVRWDGVLEPLLEHMLRVCVCTRLTNVLLRAGVLGASFRWLEGHCRVSHLIKNETSLSGTTRFLWDLYIQRARADDELIWFAYM
jgi:hypothetical protein